MIGTIREKGAMFLRVSVGTAADEDNNAKYEMSTLAGTSIPCVRSVATGRYFLLTWPEILNLAIDAGIDKEEPSHAP